MQTDTIRRLFKISLIVAAVLFVVMLIDHFANDAGLITPLAILFALVAVAMVVLLFLRPDDADQTAPQPEAEEAPLPEDYPGDVHEVVDLEGVGPAYAENLHAAGIFHTQELLFADDATLQDAVGVPAKVVATWKSMAQLVKVKGIGPQYAEALTRGGVDGIEGLAACDVAETTAAVNEYLDGLGSSVVGQRISEKRMTTWQKQARKMQKVPIDVDRIKVRPLESKQARGDAEGPEAAAD